MLSRSAPLLPGHQPSTHFSLVPYWALPCDLVLACGLWAELLCTTRKLPCVILYSPHSSLSAGRMSQQDFFFNLNTIGICSQTILCHGAFPYIIGYSEAFLISTHEIPISSPLAKVATKMFPDTFKGPLKGRIGPCWELLLYKMPKTHSGRNLDPEWLHGAEHPSHICQ